MTVIILPHPPEHLGGVKGQMLEFHNNSESCQCFYGNFACVTLLCIGTFYSCNGMYVPNFSSYEIPKWTAH